MKCLLFVIILPIFARSQDKLLEDLKIDIRINDPKEAIKINYVEDTADQNDLRVPFLTNFRFWPQSGDTVRTYCFNLDKSGKVNSLIIISRCDSIFIREIKDILGYPTSWVRFGGTSFRGNEWLFWNRGSVEIMWGTTESRQFLIICDRSVQHEELLKFRFPHEKQSAREHY